MSNSYSVSSSPTLSGNTLVGIYGQVNSTFVFCVVYKSALDQAYAANGQAGLESYLSPIMLATSQAFVPQTGDQNLTVHSSTPIPALRAVIPICLPLGARDESNFRRDPRESHCLVPEGERPNPA